LATFPSLRKRLFAVLTKDEAKMAPSEEFGVRRICYFSAVSCRKRRLRAVWAGRCGKSNHSNLFAGSSCSRSSGADVLSIQKVLSGSGRATRRWPMYFAIRRSLPARLEPDNTFRTASTHHFESTRLRQSRLKSRVNYLVLFKSCLD